MSLTVEYLTNRHRIHIKGLWGKDIIYYSYYQSEKSNFVSCFKRGDNNSVYPGNLSECPQCLVSACGKLRNSLRNN